MKAGRSLPCSQDHTSDPNLSQMNRLNAHFVIFISLRLDLPSGILPPVYQTYLSLQRENVLEACIR
jgi:hypothetical protein